MTTGPVAGSFEVVTRRVVFVLYPGVLSLDVSGPHDAFSIADISFGVFYGFAEMVEKMTGVDFERGRPNLNRWYGELSSRPSFG